MSMTQRLIGLSWTVAVNVSILDHVINYSRTSMARTPLGP